MPTESPNTTELALRMKKTFDHTFEAPLQVWEQFAAFCSLAVFKKNEIIKPAHTTERHGYFILSGSAGVFLWKENNYICLDLMFEEDFFGDTASLYTGKPSPLETMALEACEMVKISASNMELLKQSDFGKILFLQAAELDYVNKQQQQIDILLKTAEERYKDLLAKQPQIILRTPQKHIASYLGITTQSLSRIRKKLNEEG